MPKSGCFVAADCDGKTDCVNGQCGKIEAAADAPASGPDEGDTKPDATPETDASDEGDSEAGSDG